MKFDFSLPTQIIFGRGRLAELGTHAARFGSRALIITGNNAMQRSGTLGVAADALRAAGLAVHTAHGISPNPRSDEVDSAIDAARNTEADLIVGLGGGSAIDAAKAVIAGLAHGPDHAGQLVGRTLEPHPAALPLIAIPSTAGTGTEVSRGAIITDIHRSFKSGIRGPDLAPRLAIVDPAVCSTAPHAVAVETAFDTLTHAVETYIARRATPIGRALSESACRLLARRLPQLAAGDRGDALKDDLSLAALYGGINVANSGSCLPHRLQQAMGALSSLSVSHGRGLAALYPSWLRYAQPSAVSDFAQLAQFLGGAEIQPVITDLLNQLGLPSNLAEIGVVRTDLDTILDAVSGETANDPCASANGDCQRAILTAALGPSR